MAFRSRHEPSIVPARKKATGRGPATRHRMCSDRGIAARPACFVLVDSLGKWWNVDGSRPAAAIGARMAPGMGLRRRGVGGMGLRLSRPDRGSQGLGAARPPRARGRDASEDRGAGWTPGAGLRGRSDPGLPIGEHPRIPAQSWSGASAGSFEGASALLAHAPVRARRRPRPPNARAGAARAGRMTAVIASPMRVRLRLAGLLLGVGLATAGCLLPPLIVPMIPPVKLHAPSPREVLVQGPRRGPKSSWPLGSPDSRHHDDRYFVYGWTQVYAAGSGGSRRGRGGLVGFPSADPEIRCRWPTRGAGGGLRIPGHARGREGAEVDRGG